jgi:hypothetical protein
MKQQGNNSMKLSDSLAQIIRADFKPQMLTRDFISLELRLHINMSARAENDLFEIFTSGVADCLDMKKSTIGGLLHPIPIVYFYFFKFFNPSF